MLGEKIRELRRAKKISQEEFALAIGYSRSLIVNWEKGTRDPSTQTLLKIADFFNVSLDYLLGREDYSRNCYRHGLTHSALPENEHALLEAFRPLLPEMQAFVLDMLKSLQKVQNKL